MGFYYFDINVHKSVYLSVSLSYISLHGPWSVVLRLERIGFTKRLSDCFVKTLYKEVSMHKLCKQGIESCNCLFTTAGVGKSNKGSFTKD